MRSRENRAMSAVAERREWHERHRSQRPGQALRQYLGAARVHHGDPGRARGRAGRPEQRRDSTLLNLTVGLAAPTTGTVTVLGGQPAGSPAALDGVAFVAQDTPLYKNLSVADLLHLTRNLNWRTRPALRPVPAGRAGHPAEAQGRPAVRRPAGAARADPGAGPAAQAAGAGRADGDAQAGRPARLHGRVMTAMADDGVSVVLSSHVLTELERVADYLILMSQGQVQVAGEVNDLLGQPPGVAGQAAEAGQAGRAAEHRRAHPHRPGAPGPPARRAEANAQPGAVRLGRASGQPGRTCPGLPARAPGAAALPGPARGRPVPLESGEPSEVRQ